MEDGLDEAMWGERIHSVSMHILPGSGVSPGLNKRKKVAEHCASLFASS